VNQSVITMDSQRKEIALREELRSLLAESSYMTQKAIILPC